MDMYEKGRDWRVKTLLLLQIYTYFSGWSDGEARRRQVLLEKVVFFNIHME